MAEVLSLPASRDTSYRPGCCGTKRGPSGGGSGTDGVLSGSPLTFRRKGKQPLLCVTPEGEVSVCTLQGPRTQSSAQHKGWHGPDLDGSSDHSVLWAASTLTVPQGSTGTFLGVLSLEGEESKVGKVAESGSLKF